MITGTTADMEYADSENAVVWMACNDGNTKAAAGIWYVRFKGTEDTYASPTAKVEVTETTKTEETTDSTERTNGDNIKAGEFVSIIGPSGSGKSTLGCLDIADEGSYYLDGIAIEEYSEDDLARIRNAKIGFVFQNFNLLNKLSAQENVELPLIYKKMAKKERGQLVSETLSQVKLEERKEHKPMELSGGQQQRVAIARALVTSPAMILADEPTGNLDTGTGEEIMSLFHELHARGNTIVLITHDEKVADQADRKIRILDGRVQEFISVAESHAGIPVQIFGDSRGDVDFQMGHK